MPYSVFLGCFLTSYFVQKPRRRCRSLIEKLHCVVCKAWRLVAQGKNVSLPHRSHDKRCSMNRKIRGLSAAVFVTKAAAQNIVINNAPMASIFSQNLEAEAGTNIACFFSSPYPQKIPPDRNVARHPVATDHVVAGSTQQAKSTKKFEQKNSKYSRSS